MVYDSDRFAAAYAFDRPPLHSLILQRFSHPLVDRALDIGCGAGLSTDALAGRAQTIVGLEPVRRMLRHASQVAPGAHFVVGSADALPFASAAFDLITAAGSLNYADPSLFVPELARVLRPDGTLVVYDFGTVSHASFSSNFFRGTRASPATPWTSTRSPSRRPA